MPKGSIHYETGILRRTRQGYALERDDGGVWRLDVTGNPHELIGTRVRLEASRAGFDLLDVHRLWREADAARGASPETVPACAAPTSPR